MKQTFKRQYRWNLAQHVQARDNMSYHEPSRRWTARQYRAAYNNVAYEEYAHIRALNEGIEEPSWK